MKGQFKPALAILFALTIITGVLYPFLITGIAQIIFPYQANGSMITRNGQAVGSEMIGQQFSDPKYFWGRLSATSSKPYNASASGGSNYSVLNPSLQDQVKARLAALKAADPDNSLPVPVDLVTASASGLDPNLSVAAAEYQAARIAKFRGFNSDQVNVLIHKYTHGRIFGILGEKTVNVLEINLALDELQ